MDYMINSSKSFKYNGQWLVCWTRFDVIFAPTLCRSLSSLSIVVVGRWCTLIKNTTQQLQNFCRSESTAPRLPLNQRPLTPIEKSKSSPARKAPVKPHPSVSNQSSQGSHKPPPTNTPSSAEIFSAELGSVGKSKTFVVWLLLYSMVCISHDLCERQQQHI